MSLPEKLAQAQADTERWRVLAAHPSLSPQAAAWANDIARSSAAAAALYKKAIEFEAEVIENQEKITANKSNKVNVSSQIDTRSKKLYTMKSDITWLLIAMIIFIFCIYSILYEKNPEILYYNSSTQAHENINETSTPGLSAVILYDIFAFIWVYVAQSGPARDFAEKVGAPLPVLLGLSKGIAQIFAGLTFVAILLHAFGG